MNNSEFIQDTTLSLDYLADDFNNLPEIQDGINEEEIKAAERIANLMRSADPEVQQGLQLIEKYGVPPEEKGHWIDFETPKYNTQLEVLFWLAERQIVVVFDDFQLYVRWLFLLHAFECLQDFRWDISHMG